MTYPIGMTCQQLVELVTSYVEDRLAADERLRFEAHLGVCPGCIEYLEQMQTTIRALGTLREESIEPSMRERLLGIFRDWQQPA